MVLWSGERAGQGVRRVVLVAQGDGAGHFVEVELSGGEQPVPSRSEASAGTSRGLILWNVPFAACLSTTFRMSRSDIGLPWSARKTGPEERGPR